MGPFHLARPTSEASSPSACPSSDPSRSKGILFGMTETNIYYARARA